MSNKVERLSATRAGEVAYRAIDFMYGFRYSPEEREFISQNPKLKEVLSSRYWVRVYGKSDMIRRLQQAMNYLGYNTLGTFLSQHGQLVVQMNHGQQVYHSLNGQAPLEVRLVFGKVGYKHRLVPANST